MLTNGLPAPLNISLVAGKETARVFYVFNEDGSKRDMRFYTFSGLVTTVEGEEYELSGSVSGAQEHCVTMQIPALPMGTHRYSLNAASDTGEIESFVSGVLGVQYPDLSALNIEPVESPTNAVIIKLPGDGGIVRALWAQTSLTGKAVMDAIEAAKAAEESAKAAERSKVDAEAAKEDVLEELSKAQAFMASFNEALYNAIRIDSNSVLWVGGYCTGHVLKGEPGVTPHIGLDGFWYEGNKKLGDRPAFGKDGINPHITPDGFWAFGDFKSDTRAEGRDGLDGSAVRRIPVERYEDIPQSGETCNGGFLYYVPAGVERTVRQVVSVPATASVSNYTLAGPMVFSDARTWTRRGGRLMRFGLMAGSNTSGGEPSAEQLYAHLYYEAAGEWVYAGRSTGSAPQVVNEVSWWDFGELELVPSGSRIKVLLSQVAAEPTADQAETIRVQVTAVASTEGSNVGGAAYCARAYWQYETDQMTNWDTYAWLESKGWVRVDINYDIATSEVYGLNKLGTDSVVLDGAPVGVNAAGQMEVPIADPALAGAVLPSSTNNESSGGRTHVGEDKKLYVDFSTPSTPGVGKTSYTVEVENTATVGMTEDNKYAVPPAAAFQWGAVRIGTTEIQTMKMPWIIPIGMAAAGVINEYGQNIRGQLMNNLLVNGALRTGTRTMWESWNPNGADYSRLPTENSNAVGIMAHPEQFTQSAVYGLELLPATTQTLSGVYIARGPDDDRDTAVVNAKILRATDASTREWVTFNYYNKEEVYTKAQVSTLLENELTHYVTRTFADAKYMPKNEPNLVRSGVGGLAIIHKMSKSAFDALESRDAHAIYLVKRG